MSQEPMPTSALLQAHCHSYRMVRNRVLRTLDPAEIIAFAKQHAGIELATRHQALATAHHARIQSTDFTAHEKIVSRLWLEAHGIKP